MDDTFHFGGEIVWRPTPELIQNSRLKKFMDQYDIPDFQSLMHRSTTDLDWFWNAVLKDLDIQFYKPYSNIVDLSKGIEWPVWCVDGVMNIVHNCLDKYIGTPKENHAALIWEGEDGLSQQYTYGQLYREVNKCANALRSIGLKKGDAIGLYLPMIPEIVIALLAIAKIGGIILPLFSGYGETAIVSRLKDADAVALFTADGFDRRGQVVNMKQTADAAAAQVSTLKHMIVAKRANADIAMFAARDHWWHELIDPQSDQSPTEHTSAEDPLMILYTSGTTGKPKGALHTHCGFPIKAAQDMAHGLDLHPDEILYWMTDMGWMMGPWLVFGTLILGATMMIYDGAPDYPAPDRLWALIEKHKVTALGISPTLVRALIKFGDAPIKKHDVSSLRKFGSTGEPWNPDPWLWLFNTVGGGQLPIINYSGGTEISGGIVMGNVLLPLKPCAFSAPVPGMAADVVNEHGNSIRNQVGELVIRQPWIGMTRGFWHAPDRYIQTYWSRFPKMWVHGDWAAIDNDGLWYILGRSDDTIKVAGKRLGPAEVESILVSHPDVSESAAIGVPDPIKGQAVVCFCVLKPTAIASDQLRETLKDLVANELGKPLKPNEIKFVKDLPKTRNAKVMRRIIRSAYLGQELGDTSSLENPSAVEEIKRSV
ncbi:MAG TPA: AMP-binding protein [Anaerolineae bacterium]|nr:AMP-binding protein [Anaerolineae bacterium]